MQSVDPACRKLSSAPLDISSSRADALAQPTRARLFARLAELGRPASTDELAVEVGLHPSGVRVHLERLRAVGLLTREPLPRTLGRPPYGWQVAPDAVPGGEPPAAYRDLARWLARSIPARSVRLREVEQAGRELGRELVITDGRSAAAAGMGRTLTALGFDPESSLTERGRVAFKLGNCPYRDAVRENQPVVCALHRGLTQGLLDGLQPSARLASFVPEDPERAGCLIEVQGLGS